MYFNPHILFIINTRYRYLNSNIVKLIIYNNNLISIIRLINIINYNIIKRDFCTKSFSKTNKYLVV